MSKPKIKPKPKTRWTREFKLQALSRMDDAVDVTALARELGVQRELLYLWRRKYRSGGVDALHPIGRPKNSDRPFDEARTPSSLVEIGARRRRIEEPERKTGQQLDLDFFSRGLAASQGATPSALC